MCLRQASPAVVAAAASLLAMAALPVRALHAEEIRPGRAACACPWPAHPPKASPRSDHTDRSRDLDVGDEVTALDAIRIALTQVGDGSSFVWHRPDGRLSGVVHPTRSFKDASGRVCRHIVVILTTAARAGRIEGIACRLSDGGWQLEG